MSAVARWRMSTSVFLSILLVGMVSAKAPPASSKPDGRTDKQIERLIKDLDSNTFRTRAQAAKELEKAGVRALDAVSRHAEKGSLETRLRCFKILAKSLWSKDERVAAGAKAVLEKLAKSDNRRVANQAKSALKKSEQKKLAPEQVAKAGGLQVQRMRMDFDDGQGTVAHVEVQASGGTGPVCASIKTDRLMATDVKVDGKRIWITENQQGAIEVQITGKDIKTFTAKNAAELKKKYPEAYKLYKKYGRSMVHKRAVQPPKKGAGK